MADGGTLEQEIEGLLDQDKFEPPDGFADGAVVADEGIYDEAEKDYEGFWAERASALDWAQEWDQVLDWSEPPFAKWFVGGKLNVAHNCVDRHVEAGRGDRVAIHWRGEEGEERDITYADLHRDVQRFANALKDRGIEAGDVVGIFLPMIPEVVVAMLACARIGAPHNVVFGGFSASSVRERMEFSEAKALITVDGARRKGRTAAIKSAGRRGDGRPREPRDDHRGAGHEDRVRDAGGPRLLVPRGHGAGGRRVPGGAARRRAPAVHPLHVGLHGQAQGHPAHHRRLPHAGGLHPQGRLRPAIRTRTSTSARPTSAGSPATPTSSTARWPTARRPSCTRARPTTPPRTSGGSCASATA